MSKRMTRYATDRKVYVGDLGDSARKNDLEHAFGVYGKLRSVWVARNPPGFAFVEFEDARDAADAVHGLDGRTLCGRRARVELSTGRIKGSSRRGMSDRDYGRVNKCYECGGRGHFARQCRNQGRGRRRSTSRSRSRHGSRGRRSNSSSRSLASSKDTRKSRNDCFTENGRNHNDDDDLGYAHDRNDTRKDSSKRRYSESSASPSPKRDSQIKSHSAIRRHEESSMSRSRSGSHRHD